MKKKQKSRENAMKEELLGQGKEMKTSSLSLWSGEIRVYSGIHSVCNLKINEGVQ